MTKTLTAEQFSILDHTIQRAAMNRYCGGGAVMGELVEMGLMRFIGVFIGNDYYTITDEGRRAHAVGKNSTQEQA